MTFDDIKKVSILDSSEFYQVSFDAIDYLLDSYDINDRCNIKSIIYQSNKTCYYISPIRNKYQSLTFYVNKQKVNKQKNSKCTNCYTPEAYIGIKLTISDNLKNYLMKYKSIGENKIIFGEYLGKKIYKTNALFLSSQKKCGKIHFPDIDYYKDKTIKEYNVYEYKNNRFITYHANCSFDYGWKVIEFEPLIWYLKPKTNELILSRSIRHKFFIDKFNNIDYSKNLKFEDTKFYQEYLTKYFIEEIFQKEDIFKNHILYSDYNLNINDVPFNKKDISKITIGNKNDFDLPLSELNLSNDSKDAKNNIYIKENNCLVNPCFNPNEELNLKDYIKFYDTDKSPSSLRISLESSYIIPKMIVSDKLKKYLMDNRLISNYNDDIQIVEFGNYLEKINLSRWQFNKIFKKNNIINKVVKTPMKFQYDNNVYNYNNQEYILINNQAYIFTKEKWYLNINTNELVMAKKILTNFNIDKKDNIDCNKEIRLEDTLFYKEYLSNIFTTDLLKDEVYFNKELDSSNDEINDFEIKISKIKSLILNDISSDIFNTRLRSIIEDYNNNLALYEKNANKILTFGILDDNTLENNLEIELNSLIENINRYKEKTFNYTKMLDYLNIVSSVLKGAPVDENDEFLALLSSLKKSSLSYLNNEKYNNELVKEIYNKPKLLIENNIRLTATNNECVCLPFNTQEEFIIYLRRVLHPILEKIAIAVDNKNICEEIVADIKNIQTNNYIQSNNRIKELYLSLINEMYNELVSSMTDEDIKKYKDRINSILNKKIDYNDDLTNVFNELANMYYKLNNISFELKNNNNKKHIKQKYIKLD